MIKSRHLLADFFWEPYTIIVSDYFNVAPGVHTGEIIII
jgi:hypothetical protein